VVDVEASFTSIREQGAMLPTLRADFQLAETYLAPFPATVGCPVVAFGGTNDSDIKRSDLDACRDVGNGSFRLHMFEGGHFFIHPQRRAVKGSRVSPANYSLTQGNASR